MSLTHLLPVDWLQELAVFPLPRVVFFPGTQLPLHIFEPRYRAMMRDCLQSGRLAMAVTLLKPGYESDYEGRPPMHDVCTIGRIEKHEELPDGRFNLLLRGLNRVKLHELPAGDLPYRRAHVELLDLRRGSERCSREALTTLMSTASRVAAVVRRAHPDFSLGIQPDDAPHNIADTLADRLLAEPAARQDILETLDVSERVKKVTSYVASLLGQLEFENTKRPLQ
ncbi:MAG TPA: LON peptidase substrate-binding domain-containing protein [Polyangiales bacterium]